MTYYVSSGTLNPTHSLTLTCLFNLMNVYMHLLVVVLYDSDMYFSCVLQLNHSIAKSFIGTNAYMSVCLQLFEISLLIIIGTLFSLLFSFCCFVVISSQFYFCFKCTARHS